MLKRSNQKNKESQDHDSFTDLLNRFNFDKELIDSVSQLNFEIPSSEQKQLVENVGTNKHIVLQSGYQTGRTSGAMILLINDLLQHIKDWKPKELQPDEDTVSGGLFSVILCQSKDITQKNYLMLDNILRGMSGKQQIHSLNINNLFQQQQLQAISILPNRHYVLMGTPANFVKFVKATNIDYSSYVNICIDDIDFMLSFGYREDLDNIQFLFLKFLEKLKIVIVTQELSEDVKAMYQKFQNNGLVIENQPNQEEEQQEADELEEVSKANKKLIEIQHSKVTQFYSLGDETNKYILLYIIYKLHFIVGKTLIICQDIDTVYKLYLFLERIGVPHIQLYNPNNPQTLRYYILSIFNTGVIKTLIATPRIFQDIENKTFYKTKRKILSIRLLNNLIVYNIACAEVRYVNLFKHFRGSEGTIVSLVKNEEKDIEVLTKLIDQQKREFSQLNLKEFPLKKDEINAFRYRVSDVLQSLSRRQVLTFQELDFKKKLIKSADLKEYFQKNPNDRQLLIDNIQKLGVNLQKNAVFCSQDIPDYLIPQAIKDQYKKFEQRNSKITKILVHNKSDNYEESLKKRMNNNDLTLDDVKKKRKVDKFTHVIINQEQENAEEMDPSRLKAITGRKIWKLKHGFKLKKRNKRLEKKGIFNN